LSGGLNVLVTGARSGLGKAIADHFHGQRVNRGEFDAFRHEYRNERFDAIFHCAFNSAKQVALSGAGDYVYDNLFFTQELLEIPCVKFVYISTPDLYPHWTDERREDTDFDVTALPGIYSFTKLASELAIQRRTKNFLICRPTTFLGPSMRPNTTLRLLTERNPRLFLRPESRFNYVLHRDVVGFLEVALRRDLTGIYNIACRGTVRLADICDDLGLTPQFGDYLYDIGNVSNAKVASHYAGFTRSSVETLNEFIDKLGHAFIGRGRVRDRQAGR